MFVESSYKEGTIYSQKKGLIYSKIRFAITSQDEKIYSALKEIQALLNDSNTCIKISYIQDNILDNRPPTPKTSELGEIGDILSESIITVPSRKFIIENIIFTDEQIYGKNLDGENREYRLFWKDENNVEYPVPLKDFDNFECQNPNHEYSYNSETHELIFEIMVDEPVDYILRRYKVE